MIQYLLQVIIKISIVKLFKAIISIILMSKDYLTEDSLLPSSQKFVCISFLSDTENKLSLKGVKVRGAFNTVEEASEHAKNLQSIDQAHNVFVGEMGKWLAYEPDVNSEAAGNPEYANEQLNTMMRSYLENQEKSKLFHEQRKFQQIQKTLEQSIETSNNTVKELEEKLLEEKDEENIKDLNSKLETINSQIKELEEKKKDFEKKEKKVNQQVNSQS